MTSRERILAAIDGRDADHVPLTTWCFGFPAPPELRWRTEGREIPFWYSLRLEHLHTLPHPWTIEDECRRASAWLSLGMDDVLDVSVPWGRHPDVKWTDTVIPPGGPGGDPRYPVLVREYRTPDGPLRHAVRKTEPETAGWPGQPNHVPLIEDYNIPRAVRHVVSTPSDVPAIRHVFGPPTAAQMAAFARQVSALGAFADEKGVALQAWTAFGMDAAVWFCGTEGAIMMAMDAPEAFGRLMDIIFEADYARTELAVTTRGVDIVCQRGWYSSTDFWSPDLFERYVFPHLSELAALVHGHRRKLGYVMTTGLATFGERLADAGVDVLYFADPVQDRLPLDTARRLAQRMTVVGGTNALSLASGDPHRIRNEVRRAMEALGPTRRFILHPVDAIFPDTPWAGVQTMIEAWKECR